ncbi:MAG: hypothetical protein LBQ18_05070 [Campylobacteraceae bacterium]|jgi:hypothetical protein|nr:hypothetical protein [Campylobacteraceae bacterium]
MKALRFIYLNSYAILLILLGACTLLVPLYKITPFLLIIQLIISLKCFMLSCRLFSAWGEKRRIIKILMRKNSVEFRPESFKVYMQAPCSRLLVRFVLKRLGKKSRYKELLIYKKSLLDNLKESISPSKTVIYINESYQ